MKNIEDMSDRELLEMLKEIRESSVIRNLPKPPQIDEMIAASEKRLGAG